jgi:hypothetical protein
MRADEKLKRCRVIRRAHAACALFAIAMLACAAQAQTTPDPGEVHGLKLGLNAETMNTDDWGELACGSNGGPPRQHLDRWSEFKKCSPERSGLHEVYARFDDEAEYIGKAIDDPLFASEQTGTRVAGHPVILSALFDDAGVLRGIRMVSDPRGTPLERRMAHLLKLAVMNHYGPDGWTCKDFPPDPRETPVGGVFIKQRCEKTTSERAMTVEAHFLRKPGQNAIDPATNEYTQGQFESWTRFELMDPSYKKP